VARSGFSAGQARQLGDLRAKAGRFELEDHDVRRRHRDAAVGLVVDSDDVVVRMNHDAPATWFAIKKDRSGRHLQRHEQR
jgi:hypothetical protein